MLVAKHFLQLLGTEKEGTVIGMTSSAGLFVAPGISAYSLGKLADLQLTRYISAENSNITAISYHPGIFLTDMHQDAQGFREFAKDTPELAGGVAVWLSTKAAAFLDGRFMAVNWAVDELIARKEEIVSGDLLKIKLGGEFGDAVLQM
jgi:NAD(P)-dependent dehydrogenase (short-subunit alcohol dehydrogenase family)